jgi:hypothetical protein
MSKVVIKTQPGHLNATGVSFMVYATRYQEVADVWMSQGGASRGFDVVSYQLLCQALELHLKSFIWLKDQIDRKTIKTKYSHDLRKLWRDSKRRGIAKYAATTPLRDRVIGLVGPYYKDRKFSYLDLDMIFKGYGALKSDPSAKATIRKLNLQLEKALRTPILEAS